MLVRGIIYLPMCGISYILGVYNVWLSINTVKTKQLYVYLITVNVTIIYIHTESSVEQYYICYMSFLLYIEYLIKKDMYNDF